MGSGTTSLAFCFRTKNPMQPELVLHLSACNLFYMEVSDEKSISRLPRSGN